MMKTKITNFIKMFFDASLWKFLLVGVVNTLFGSAIMFVFYNIFGIPYWISTASNYVFGSILSYFLNKYFTFKSKNTTVSGVVKFIVNVSICYLIAYGGAKQLVLFIFDSYSTKLKDNIAMLVGMVAFTFLNYCGQRFFVFRKNNEKSDEASRNND